MSEEGNRIKPAKVVAYGNAAAVEALRRVQVVCTRCGREVVNGDCGTPHAWGTAQMQMRIGGSA